MVSISQIQSWPLFFLEILTFASLPFVQSWVIFFPSFTEDQVARNIHLWKSWVPLKLNEKSLSSTPSNFWLLASPYFAHRSPQNQPLKASATTFVNTFHSFLLFFFFLATPLYSLQDLSSPIRDWTCNPGQWEHRVLIIKPPGNSSFLLLMAVYH